MRQAIPDEAFWTDDTVRDAIRNGEPPAVIARIACVVGHRAVSREGQQEARELIAAGWQPDVLHADDMVYQWRWRRPPRIEGKPGRLFRSTAQAHNAMRRENVER